MKRKYLALAALPFVLMACDSTDKPTAAPTTSIPVTSSLDPITTTTALAAKYTQAMCDQLKPGLSYDQVAKIFGDPGHATSHMDATQYSKAYDMYEWSDKSAGFQSIMVNFEDLTVTSFSCYI